MTSSYRYARSTRRDGCSTQARRGLTVAGRWRDFIHTQALVMGKAFCLLRHWPLSMSLRELPRSSDEHVRPRRA